MDEILVQPEKKGWLHQNFSPVLALLTVMGTFFLFYVFSVYDCKANKEVVFYILGAITGAMTNILGYFFGSSAGSSQKNELLAQKK